MSADNYLKARSEYNRVKQELDGIIHFLRQTASALEQQPTRMIFSNVSGGLPAEASMSRDSVSINGDDFPKPADIQAVLGRYHAARDNYRNSWLAIPSDMHSGLQPPPRGILPERTQGQYY